MLQDPALGGALEDRRGIYRHPIIQKAINIVWFVNKSDEGVVYSDYFKPISNATIALVLTVVGPSPCSIAMAFFNTFLAKIQNCLDEWGTGRRIPVAITETEYSAVYKDHVTNLEAYESLCNDTHALLLGIRKTLYREAR